MTDLWSPNLKVGELGHTRIDVSEFDEVYVEAEGYVHVVGVDDE